MPQDLAGRRVNCPKCEKQMQLPESIVLPTEDLPKLEIDVPDEDVVVPVDRVPAKPVADVSNSMPMIETGVRSRFSEPRGKSTSAIQIVVGIVTVVTCFAATLYFALTFEGRAEPNEVVQSSTSALEPEESSTSNDGETKKSFLERLTQSGTQLLRRGELDIEGFFVSEEIQGGLGTTGGKISPKEEQLHFVVVVCSVSGHHLMPSMTEFAQLNEGPFSDAKVANRNNVIKLEPERFRLGIGEDAMAGSVVAHWESLSSYGGFSSGMTISSVNTDYKEEQVKLAVGFLTRKDAPTESLTIQFDEGGRQAVRGYVEPPKMHSPFGL